MDGPLPPEDATADPNPIAVFLICTCCGTPIEVNDVAALVRSLHLQNVCPAMEGVLFRKE